MQKIYRVENFNSWNDSYDHCNYDGIDGVKANDMYEEVQCDASRELENDHYGDGDSVLVVFNCYEIPEGLDIEDYIAGQKSCTVVKRADDSQLGYSILTEE